MADVVIIGAGVSGLHAAYRLQQRGVDVVVLEARARTGGRLASFTAADTALDLGATWVWPGEARVTELIEELGLRTFAHFDTGVALYDAPQGPQRMPPGPVGGPARRIVGGSAALTDALHAHLTPGTVHPQQAVRRITAPGHALRVDTDTHAWPAAHVLVALPPALALASIGFDPALDSVLAQRARSTPVWMGAVVKTVAVYDRAFWRDQGFSGTAFSPRGPLQEIHDLSGPKSTPGALFGFTGLTRPGQNAPPPDQVRDQLTRLWGPPAADPVALHQQDWSREPFTSPPDAALLTAFDRFGDPILQQPHLGGRLHFCSCETHPGHGHIEDALAASARAVAAVI